MKLRNNVPKLGMKSYFQGFHSRISFESQEWNPIFKYFFYCLYTLVMRCGRVSSIKPNLVVLHFCIDRLHHVIIYHDKACSNRWSLWPKLCRTYRTVYFCNRDSGIGISQYRHDAKFNFIHPMQILYVSS